MRRMRTGDRRLDVLWMLALRWLLMGAVVYALGTAGLLWRGWMIAAAGLLGAAALATGGGPAFRDDLRGWTASLAGMKAWWAKADGDARAAAAAVAAVAGLIVLRTALHVWFVAPWGGDETVYHLPKLAVWMQEGTLARPDLWDTRSLYPGGMQALQVWWVGFLRHDVVIELAGVEFLGAAALVAFALARQAGLPRPAALLAAVLFAGLPVNVTQSTSGINDLAVTALVLTAYAFALRTGPLARDLGFIAVVGLLGMSIKPTILYACTGMVLPVAWRLMPRNRVAQEGAISPLRVGLLALAAIVGSYWYLRNALEFGNPIYPAGVSILGWQPFNERPGIEFWHGAGFGQHTSPTSESLQLNVNDLLSNRLHDAWQPFGPLCYRIAGWGWYGMALGLPAFLLALRERRLPWTWVAALMLAALVTLAMVKADAWNMRFIAWLSILPCLSIAAVLPTLGAPARRAAWYLLLLASGMNVIGATFCAGINPRTAARTVRVSWETRDGRDIALEKAVPAERGEPVAYQSLFMALYPLYGPDFSRRVFVYRGGPEELPDFMRRRGIRYAMLTRIWEYEDRKVERWLAEGRLLQMDGYWYRLGGAP
jgi:hypothetical protein